MYISLSTYSQATRKSSCECYERFTDQIPADETGPKILHALYTPRVPHEIVRLLVKYIDAAGRQAILSIRVCMKYPSHVGAGDGEIDSR